MPDKIGAVFRAIYGMKYCFRTIYSRVASNRTISGYNEDIISMQDDEEYMFEF